MSTLNYRESVDYHSEEDESSLQISSSLTGSCQSQKSQQMALQELKEECYEMTVQQDGIYIILISISITCYYFCLIQIKKLLRMYIPYQTLNIPTTPIFDF